MTRSEIIRIIVTSKYNERYTHYTRSQLKRLNMDELIELYQNFLDNEFEAVLNNKI